jgi:MiaB-like tRNA modifying enzyme
MTSVYFYQQGYSANVYDSERMAGLLKEAKFEIIDILEDADVVVINSCTVKFSSDDLFFNFVKEIKDNYPYKIIVVTGCISSSKPSELKEYSLIGTNQIHNIVQVIEEALNDNVLQVLDEDNIPPLDLPKVRNNPIVEILPINLGCLGSCAFCKTKQACGNLKSYPIEEIVNIAKKALRDGVKEIWLTSQDTFCYGFDIGTDIAELLERLVKLPGDFKIRVGMGNPDHVLKIKERLIEIYQHPKIFKFLHLPLQAGHNDVLKHMKRKYTVQQFRDTIDQFRKEIPELNFMTDVVVGYPTETEEHFWGTLQAVRRVNPDSINISRFILISDSSSSSKLKVLPVDQVDRRLKVLTDIFHNISKMQNERWVGWSGKILIDQKGKEDGQWIGRNDSYKKIIVEGDYKFGDFVEVRVEKANIFDLRGKVLKTKIESIKY